MSLKDSQLLAIVNQIQRVDEKIRSSSSGLVRKGHLIIRGALLLAHEYVRDDVKIRAQSLAFLMFFSLLPLIAGGFFVVDLFARFGMVKEAIGQFVDNFLGTIPEEHRDFVLSYINQFSESYLTSIRTKSGNLGIFALAVLFWVGLQMFNNIDRTLNTIWSSEKNRPFFQQIQNFVLAVFFVPLGLIGALSIPLILEKITAGHDALRSVGAMSSFLHQLLPGLILIAIFTAMNRLIPVRRVTWNSALAGGVFTGILLQLSNVLMNLYFRFGTQTAYGKAGVIPLIGFWIYLVWMIVILGAEVSFLFQNSSEIYTHEVHRRGFKHGQALITTLHLLKEAHQKGTNPVGIDRLKQHTGLTSSELRTLLRYLTTRNIVIETELAEHYVLARDLSAISMSALVQGWLAPESAKQSSESTQWEKSIQHWLNYFGSESVDEFVARASR